MTRKELLFGRELLQRADNFIAFLKDQSECLFATFIEQFELHKTIYAADDGEISSVLKRASTACQLIFEKNASMYFGRSAGA